MCACPGVVAFPIIPSPLGHSPVHGLYCLPHLPKNKYRTNILISFLTNLDQLVNFENGKNYHNIGNHISGAPMVMLIMSSWGAGSVDRSKCQANIGAEAATDISLENWDDSDREDSILLVKKKKKQFLCKTLSLLYTEYILILCYAFAMPMTRILGFKLP